MPDRPERPYGRVRGAVRALLVLAVLAAAIPMTAALSSTGAAHPRCFGAASRDPLHPCHNPALDRTVTPTIGQAQLMPGWPCRIVRHRRPDVCAFAVPVSKARGTIATIGDSHSAHWRAALAGVAAVKRWHAYQLYRSSCPYSLAVTVIHPPDGALCERWRRDVIAWVTAHPDVRTVFVSEHRVHIAIPPGQTRLQTEIKGYVDAWNALPSTVRHIYVIRDTPYNRFTTNHCISQALIHHQRPGVHCRVPRRVAVHLDPAAIAARQLDSPRVSVIDLTHYFCGARFCYPVIGGVLVHIDDDHITRVYSTSLAPYLLRAINATPAAGS